MYIYHYVQITKIIPADMKAPITGQFVFVDAHPLINKGAKYGFLDPQRLATEDMIGKWVDMAILVPSGTFELYHPEDNTQASEFHAYNHKRPSVLSFNGFVKGVHVADEWHKDPKYSHLILVEACAQEILVNVDDHIFDSVMIGDMIKVNASALHVLDIGNPFVRMIEQNMGHIKRVEDRLGQTPPEELFSAYGIMARYSCEIAVYYMTMGDENNALQWFENSFELFQKSNKSYSGSELYHVTWLLYTSILSKRPDFIRSAAEKSCDLKYERSNDIYYLDACMIHLILGNEAEALQIAEEFEGRERNCGPKAKRYYKGLGTVCLGIARKDADIFKSGLNKVLQNHHNKQRGLYGFGYDSLVCFPATVLALMAKGREINVTPDDVDLKSRTYIPWLLLD